MRTARLRSTAIALSAALLLAACGSDSDSGSADSESGGSTDPVKLVFLWSDAGEDEFAIADFSEGANMAVEEINEAGGIDGRPIEYERVPAPLTPQEALNAYLNALEKDPSVIVGVGAPSIATAVAPRAEDGGVPILQLTSSPVVNLLGDSGEVSPWMFSVPTSAEDTAAATAQYVIEDLAAKSVALLHVNDPQFVRNIEVVRGALEDAGVEVVADLEVPVNATDLTTEVLAIKSANPDAVINWSFPNPTAVQMRQFAENGLTVPVVTGPASPLAVSFGTVKPEQWANTVGTSDCDPISDERADVAAWGQEYLDRYDHVPTVFGATAYDAVYLAKDAIERAGSDDPAKVRDALAETDTDGVCSTAYKAGEDHQLNHSVRIVGFDADGKLITRRHFESVQR